MRRILLVDDEPNILRALRRSLHDETWEIDVSADVRDALKRVQTTPYDLVVSDYRMPVMDGVEFLSRTRDYQPDAVRMILSGHADRDAVLAAINQAAITRYVSKPWDDYELRIIIRESLRMRAVLVENQHLAEQVRQQRKQLSAHQRELQRLEREQPGITAVDWTEDGSIYVDEAEYS